MYIFHVGKIMSVIDIYLSELKYSVTNSFRLLGLWFYTDLHCSFNYQGNKVKCCIFFFFQMDRAELDLGF